MSVEKLVSVEPWRKGSGQPRNALDPTWTKERAERCGGAIQREDGTDWWFCTECGCCGNHDFAKAHKRIQDPSFFFLQSMREFVDMRVSQGLDVDTAQRQMAHIAGVAIRYAATLPPEAMEGYIQQLMVKR